MTAADARFAGGTILVDQGKFLDDDRIVILELPGLNGVPLFPHEARALADALRAAAHEVDKRPPIKRSADVDERLRALDD